MFFNKKKQEEIKEEVKKEEEKPTPAYLRDDYPYKAIGEPITDLDTLIPNELYEIKCHKCEMSIRSQGVNIKSTYERLMNNKGCLGCGNKDLVVKLVDTSKMPKNIEDIKNN